MPPEICDITSRMLASPRDRQGLHDAVRDFSDTECTYFLWPEEIVYQESDGNEIEAFADFLNFLNDHYGPSTSRHSPKRIRITVEPGDKWQGDAQPSGSKRLTPLAIPSLTSSMSWNMQRSYPVTWSTGQFCSSR